MNSSGSGSCSHDCGCSIPQSLVMTISGGVCGCEYAGPMSFSGMPACFEQAVLTMPLALQFTDGPQTPALARREVDWSIRVEKLGPIEGNP